MSYKMKTKAVVTAGLCAALTLTGTGVALAETNNISATDVISASEGVNASAVARIGEKTYGSLQEAVNGAAQGDVIVLESAVDLEETVVVDGKSLILNLNGKEITNSKDIWDESQNAWSLISVRNGGNLTINGEGALRAKEDDCYALDIQGIANNDQGDLDTSITINGGTYVGNISMAYVIGKGSLTINQGDFSIQQLSTDGDRRFLLNCNDDSYRNKAARIEVNGGTFHGFNPGNCLAEGESTTFLGYGAQVAEGAGDPYIYTVSQQDRVAVVDGTGYITLGDAISAAQDNVETVITLQKDITENVVIPDGKIITLDLNGKNLTAENDKDTIVVDGGKLNVADSTATNAPVVDAENGTVRYDSGQIIANGGAAAAVKVQRGGMLNIESGKLDSNGDCAVFVLGNMNPVGSDDEGLVSSTVNMSGGYVEAQEFALTVQGRGATMNVTGGVAKAFDNAVLAGNGTNSADRYCGGTVMNVSGGEFIGNISSAGYIACGVYHPQVGVLNISGSAKFYVNNGVGVLMRGGTLKMTGGTIETTGTASGKVGDSSVIANCYGIYVDGSANYYGSKLDGFGAAVSNGTVKTQADVPALNLSEGKDTKGAIKVTGGSFSSNPKDFVEEGYDIEESNGVFNVSKHQDPIPPVTPPTSSDKTEVEHSQDGSTTTTVTKPDGSQTITHETATGTESVVKKDSEGNVTSTEVSVSKTDAASGKVELPIAGAEPVTDIDKAPAVEVKVPTTVTADKPVQVTVPVAKAEGAEPNYGVVVFAIDEDGNETLIPKTAVDDDGSVVFEATGNVAIKVVDAAKDMPDVTDADWFAGGVVDFATARGIVNGVDTPSGKQFRGYDGTSRGMLVAMLHNLELNPEAASAGSLPDVSADAFYAEAAAWALGEGILSGVDMPDGTKEFQGDAPVTREQVAVFLMRYAESLGMDTSRRAEVDFPDAGELSGFAKDAMSWAVAEGLFKGNDATGELNPTDGAARAEVAAVLMRFINLMYA